MSEEQLKRARRGLETLDWPVADDAFDIAHGDGVSLSAEDLEAWATPRYMLGRVEGAAEILALAFNAHLE